MNTDKLKQMYASGGLLRAILKDPKMRQMASEMLSSEGKEYEEGGMMEYEEGEEHPVKPKYAGKNEWAMSPHGVAFIAAEMDDRGIGFRSDEATKVLQGIMASDPDFAAQIIDNAFARAADESRNRYSTNTFSGGYGQNQQVGNVPGYRTTINKPSGYRM
jgi:hypothetical protein